jgi:hypothetical protein
MQRKTTISSRPAVDRSWKPGRKKALAGQKAIAKAKSGSINKNPFDYWSPLFRAKEHDPL